MSRPTAARCWWRVMIGTYASWLPGDRRGFRNRGHRIHSSGDYRNPPPPEEHEGLRELNVQQSGGKVEIPLDRRASVAKAIARLLMDSGYRVRVVSVSGCHAHLLAELPVDLPSFRRVIGQVKVKSSRTLKDVLPGRVWSRGDKHILVKDAVHLAAEFGYIRDKQGPGARAWCEGEPAG